MKKLISTLSFLIVIQFGFSQETYTFNNETLELKSEINGALDLLWTSGSNGIFRYFIKTANNALIELKNTKTDKIYNKEYISTLYELTKIDANKVAYTLYGIKYFISEYNGSKDHNYIGVSKGETASRLAIFSGLTNHPFISNPENKTAAIFAAELEILDAKNKSKHVGFVNLRHALFNKDLKYTSTQLALGYRYRFLNSKKINVFAQTKFATITYAETEVLITDPNDVTKLITTTDTGTTFDAPLTFGLGIDLKIGNNSYITFIYDSFYSVFLDNHNFPLDLAIGYKFSL